MVETRDPQTQATEPSVGQRVASGGIWVAASSYWVVGFGFIANILLTRILSPDVFGGFALAMSFAQLLRVQPKLGLGTAFAHYRAAEPDAVSTYIIVDTAAALSGLLINLLAVPVLILTGYDGDVVLISVVLALSTVVEGLGGIGGTLMDKELHFRPTSLVRTIIFPLSYIPAFWLAKHGGGVWSLVAQHFAQNLLFLVGLAWAVRHYLPELRSIKWRVSGITFRKYLGFGITVGLGVLAATFLTQLDTLLIGTFVSIEALGFYDRAYRTAQWPSLLLTSLTSRVAFFGYAHLQSEVTRLQRMLEMTLWIVTHLAMPIALMLFISAPDLVVLAYGEVWLPAALFLRILVAYSVMRPLWENAGSFFTAIGRPKTITQLVGIQAVLLAALGLPLTLIWGTAGTAVAVSAVFLIGTLIIYRRVFREFPVQIMDVVGLPALASLLTVLGYVVLSRYGVFEGPQLAVRVGIKAVYTFVTFGGFVLLMHPRPTLERIRQLRHVITQTP